MYKIHKKKTSVVIPIEDTPYLNMKEIMLKCKIIPNNAMRQRDNELEKGGEIPKKMTQKNTEFPKLILVTKVICNRARTVA